MVVRGGDGEVEDQEKDPEKGAAEPNPGMTKVDLDPDDDDDDDEPAPKAARGDGQPRDKATGKWTEKKRERQQDFKAKKAWETEKETVERRHAEEKASWERRFGELEGRLRATQTPAQQAQPNPFDAQLADLSKSLQAELKALAADDQRPIDRYEELRAKQTELQVAKLLDLKTRADAATRRPADPLEQQYQARGPILQSEYPWTMDPNCRPLTEKAWSYRNYLVDVEGRPPTLDTDREALSHIQAKFGAQYGLQPPARPSQAQRDQWARPAHGRNGTGGEREPRTMEIPRDMAEGHGLDKAALARALAGD